MKHHARMNDGNHLMAKRMGNKLRPPNWKKLVPKKSNTPNAKPGCYEEMMDCKAAKQ